MLILQCDGWDSLDQHFSLKSFIMAHSCSLRSATVSTLFLYLFLLYFIMEIQIHEGTWLKTEGHFLTAHFQIIGCSSVKLVWYLLRKIVGYYYFKASHNMYQYSLTVKSSVCNESMKWLLSQLLSSLFSEKCTWSEFFNCLRCSVMSCFTLSDTTFTQFFHICAWYQNSQTYFDAQRSVLVQEELARQRSFCHTLCTHLISHHVIFFHFQTYVVVDFSPSRRSWMPQEKLYKNFLPLCFSSVFGSYAFIGRLA
jgi:hypothetical protein